MTNDFWEKTYRENASYLLAVCYRYVENKTLAEDLMHEAFLTAINRFDTFTGRGNFRGWLRKIAINTALLYLRHSVPTNLPPSDLSEEELYNYPGDDLRSVIENAQFSTDELLNIVNQLPSPFKEVFNLYVIDEYSHAEISKILHISEGTSKSYLARARKKVQKLLYEMARKKEKDLHTCWSHEISTDIDIEIIGIKSSVSVGIVGGIEFKSNTSESPEYHTGYMEGSDFLYRLFKNLQGIELTPLKPLNFAD